MGFQHEDTKKKRQEEIKMQFFPSLFSLPIFVLKLRRILNEKEGNGCAGKYYY